MAQISHEALDNLPLAAFSLTNGVRFYSLAHLYRMFAPMGMTPRHVRNFLKTLKIPLIRVNNNAFVNLFWLSVVLFHASRPGQPDTFVSIRTPRAPECPRTIQELSLILLELLHAQSITLQRTRTPSQLRSAALEALARSVRCGLAQLSDEATVELRQLAAAHLASATRHADPFRP